MFAAPLEQGTDRLVFRLWPNGPRYAQTGAQLSVSAVRERGRMLPASSPNPTTLVVARPVTGGQRVVVSMNWRLVLPRETGLRMKGGGRSVRLGSFFPSLPGTGTTGRSILQQRFPLPMRGRRPLPTSTFE
jgi:hypothetical protein